MEPVEIQRADANARRRTVITLAVAVLFSAGIGLLAERNQARLEEFFAEHADFLVNHPEVFALGFLVLMLPLFGIGIYFWRFGSTIVWAKRFPPPGVAVIRDTPVLYENAAVTRGRAFQAIAVVLISCGLAVPLIMLYIFRSLSNTS